MLKNSHGGPLRAPKQKGQPPIGWPALSLLHHRQLDTISDIGLSRCPDDNDVCPATGGANCAIACTSDATWLPIGG